MISFLRGTLVQSGQETVIIDVGGLGYEVWLHSRALSLLPAPGTPLLVHTYLQVLDNDLKLIGFLNREELELFKVLLSVSGMGARGALNILAVLTPADFYQAVTIGDEKRLLTVPGIGKKTAQRLLFELKDKVEKQPGLALPTGEDRSNLEEVMEALETLGYQRGEIFPVLMELKTEGKLGDRTEENVKQVLRRKAMQMKK